jgi:hypothetical protein
MDTVLIHAGMPKTGSTSVQEWLRRNSGALRDHHGLTLVCDPGGPFDGVTGLTAYKSGPFVISNRILISYYGGIAKGAGPAVLRASCDKLVAEIDAAVADHGDIVITAEGFSRPVAESRLDFLAALEALASRHIVRFVYYVRPQHDALESRWRQWGYDSGVTPSEWVRRQLPELFYDRQLLAAEAAAPSVRFEVRAFRHDLLVEGNVVSDFARHVIGAPELAGEKITANPGLSLDLSILLHGAPLELTATPDHRRVHGVENGLRQISLAAVTADWDLPTSDQATRARAALHAIAHAEYEVDNTALVDRLGWGTGSFVPPTSQKADLASLDELLSPPVDPTVLTHFHRALTDLCAAHEQGTAG